MQVDDVIIIGGGVIGCAVARELSVRNRSTKRMINPMKIRLLEANESLLRGSSRGNSAMIHTGFDAVPDSIELKMVKRGHQLFEHFVAECRLNGISVPWKPVGALLVAFSDEEMSIVTDKLKPIAEQNGVHTKTLFRDQLLAKEPHLHKNAVGALHVPGEYIVDPWLLPMLYAAQATANGVAIELGQRVTAVGRQSGKKFKQPEKTSAGVAAGSTVWNVHTASGRSYFGRLVINCAGLHSDALERLRGNTRPGYQMFPRLGRFVAYEPPATAYVNHIILPIPTKKSKGRLIFPTVYGHIVVGPTAEDPDEKKEPQSVVTAQLMTEAASKVPALASFKEAYVFSGKRPALKGQTDYFLRVDPKKRWATIAGVRSTGLTSSLALAEWLHAELEEKGCLDPSEKERPTFPPKPLPQVETMSMHQVLHDHRKAFKHASHPISSEGWKTVSKL